MNSASSRLLVVVPALAALAVAQSGMLTINHQDDYVSVADSSAFVPQAGITVEAWFYFDPSAPGGYSHPTIIRKGPGAESYILRVSGGGGGVLQWIISVAGVGLLVYDSQVPTPLNSWHHLAGTYDGSVARLFLDGVQILENTNPGGPLHNPGGELRLAKGNGNSETWKGHLDEIRIWSTARSAAEIQSTMIQQLDAEQDLVAAWHFNGNYLDYTGNHHGTPIASVSLSPSTSPVQPLELRAPSLVQIGASAVFEVVISEPLVPYVLEMSLTGQSPGTPLPSPLGPLPLNPPLVFGTVGHLLPEIFVDFLGISDAAGLAFPTLVIPLAPEIIGVTLDSAFLTLDPSIPGTVAAISNAETSTVTAAPPLITSVTPQTAPVSGNIVLMIVGSGFQPGAVVTIGGSPSTGVVVLDPETISCIVPPAALGPADVHVLNPDGNQITLAGGLAYIPDMVISAVTPLIPTPGQIVTIIGAGFPSGVQLTVDGSPVALTTNNVASLTFTCPNSLSCSAQVVVSAPDSQTATALLNPSPVISSTFNASGPASGGGTFFILGSNFLPGTTVTVGGNPAPVTNFTFGVILLTAPPGSPGLATVQVTSTSGCSATTSYLYQ